MAPTNGKRLFLLDAYALIYRGYYAFIRNPRINSKGMNTSAVYGFVNTLLDIIRREKPELLAVVFDKGGSEMREALFEDYKANRLEQPEAIELAVPYIKQILDTMHIPVLEKEGWEADDLIGTLARKAAAKGYEVFIVTADKDFGQIVSDRIKIYRPSSAGGYEIWDIDKVKEKFGVERPEQVIDFLAMTGDSVDNVPGIPGVGEKTAKKFIAQFGSLENLLNNTQALKGKMREKVENAREQALLSKQLVTIHTDAPVEFHEDDFHMSKPDIPATEAVFKELEFRRLAEQFRELFGAPAPEPAQTAGTQYSLFDAHPEAAAPVATGQELLYQTVDTGKGLDLLLEKLKQDPQVAVGVYPFRFDFDRPLQYLAFSLTPGLVHLVPPATDRDILLFFRPVWEDRSKTLVGHDLKETVKYLMHRNIEPQARLQDTMIMHYLLQPDMRHSLGTLASSYLGRTLPSADRKKEPTADEVRHILAARTDAVMGLAGKFQAELEKTGAFKLYDQIEMPLIGVLARMELEGIRLDTSALENLSREIDRDIARLEAEIYEMAGGSFNIASPKQLGGILFEKLRIDAKPKKTKTGQYSTSEETLSRYKHRHPIVARILEWRQLQKLKNTYIDALPKQIHPRTGRIHTHFNQAVAATGRLSSTEPNLQNIPIRTPRGRMIRAAFVPSDDKHLLLSADYSQIELRLVAHLSGDENMIDAFRRGEDIHRTTAARIFRVKPEEVTREQRSRAKAVNFGIIYGVSAHGLSQQTGLSRTEAKQIIDAYFASFPKLRAFVDSQIEFAREHGYVETIMGRRRYLPDIHSRNAVVRGAAERNAINTPVQGSAADIIKLAMNRADRMLRQSGLDAQILLQVHDELVLNVARDQVEPVRQIVREAMEKVVELRVPLTADISQGENWLEAH